MRKLLVILSFLFIAAISVAQPVDFSTYERVIRRGNVSVVHQGDEYRLIVGSLKTPKICLLLGMSADLAAYQVERIRKMGREEYYSTGNRLVSFCGDSFFFSVKGKGEGQTYAFRKLNESQRFSLGAHDINAIKEAILLQYR